MMVTIGVVYALMMADVDIYIKRPSTLPLTIMDKMLMVIGELDIGPRPDTLSTITQVTMVYCCVYLLLLMVFMDVLIKMKKVIVVVMMEDVDFCLKIPGTLPFTIVKKVLLVMIEVGIGLRPAPLPPIIHVILINYWIFKFMVMREMCIGNVNIPTIPVAHTHAPLDLFQTGRF